MIKKEFHFSAAHHLEGLPEDHPCTEQHGHNYVITIELANAVVNKTGFIVDYRELSIIKKWIDNTVDHKNLNKILDFNPTAENMAEYFYNIFHSMIWQVTAVTVSETPKTSARYEPNTN